MEELINKGSEHQLEIDKLRNKHQLEIDKLHNEHQLDCVLKIKH